MMHRPHRHHLPTQDLWPTVLRTAPELQYPETLNLAGLLLDRHVESGAAARTAIDTGDARVTYGALQRLTNRIGTALLDLGVQPGDRVAMLFLNGPKLVATWLAVQKIGAIDVSTMPMLRAGSWPTSSTTPRRRSSSASTISSMKLARARSVLDHPVVLVAAGRTATIDAAPLPQGADAWLEDLMAGASDRLDAEPVANDDVVLIAYTSGSTGCAERRHAHGGRHPVSSRQLRASRPRDEAG